MKAIVYTEFGSPDVLQLQEVEKPSPKPNELLIKVFATPVSYGDLMARKFNQISPRNFTMPFLFWLPARFEFGWSKPKKNILGSEFSGKVEAIGKEVRSFKVGDAVFGYRSTQFGAYADYLCMPEDGLVAAKPHNMGFEKAACVSYGVLTALNLLKKAPIQPGQKVLINGASGGIGSAAVQLAKYYGAEVTAVCSTPKIGLVKALGADHVIDYTQEGFTKNGEKYNLIFDILGKSSFARCKGSLVDNGRYLLASFKMKQLLQMAWTAIVGNKKVICALSLEKAEDLLFIKELVEAGKIKSIVDRCYPLAQTAEAHRTVESGNKVGNIIITLNK